MILTSQNRKVIQANSANDRGQVLPAAVVHLLHPAMRPYSGMRRTRLPFGTTPAFSISKRRPCEALRQQPVCGESHSSGSGLALHPRLWARLVLCKMSRG